MIKETAREIVEEFEMFDDWMEKYEYIIELGKDLPLLDESDRVDKNLIKGCQSQVWLVAAQENGLIHYRADSDAVITKGLVALMVRALTGNSAEDILSYDLNFVSEIGLQEHLSPNRSNGLISMIKQMKMYALALSKEKHEEKGN